MFQTKVEEEAKRTFYIRKVFFEYRVIYEIIWENYVEPGRPEMTIWCMRIAYRITKVTNTH